MKRLLVILLLISSHLSTARRRGKKKSKDPYEENGGWDEYGFEPRVPKTGIYIYEWPLDISFVPPTAHEIKRGFFESCGIGRPLKLHGKSSIRHDTFYDHVYETSPYSLYTYAMQRLGTSLYRTPDPEDATLFFIPFDITHNTWMAAANKSDTSLARNSGVGKKRKRRPYKRVDASRRLDGIDRFTSLRDPMLARERLWYVLDALKNSTYFNRYGGRDHFFIEDDSPYFDWKHGVYFWRDFHELCKHCTKVTPDTTASLREKYQDVIIPSTVVAIPHPSAAHFTWKEQAEISPPPWARDHFHHRKYIISTVGTVHKADWSATRIRFILEALCRKAETRSIKADMYLSNYVMMKYPPEERNLSTSIQVCKQNYLSRNSYKMFHTIDALTIYRDSIFCLCAPGDLEVRKALFDIVGTGCIPVLFHNSTIGEYIDYIPKDSALMDTFALEDVVVSYGFDGVAIRPLNETKSSRPIISSRPSSEESIAASFDVIQHLEEFYRTQPEKIRKMQRNIELLGYRFTYAKLSHCDENTPIMKGVMPFNRTNSFAPPREDAWDILLKILYRQNTDMKAKVKPI